MKRYVFALWVLVIACRAATAQTPRIVTHDQNFGNGRVTVIEKLTFAKPTAPANRVKDQDDGIDGIGDETKAKTVVREGEPACITLCAEAWTCCRCFTDELGRRWFLASGSPVVEKPAKMKGWLMEGDLGVVYFLHESGSIFRRCNIGTDRPVIVR